MPNRKRNRKSEPTNEREDRSGNQAAQRSDEYRKLPNDPGNDPEESTSTAGDRSNEKHSKTKVRKDEKPNR